MTKYLDLFQKLKYVVLKRKRLFLICKSENFTTDEPVIQIGKFKLWKLSGMCFAGPEVSEKTKNWLFSNGKERYLISYWKPFLPSRVGKSKSK